MEIAAESMGSDSIDFYPNYTGSIESDPIDLTIAVIIRSIESDPIVSI